MSVQFTGTTATLFGMPLYTTKSMNSKFSSYCINKGTLHIPTKL